MGATFGGRPLRLLLAAACFAAAPAWAVGPADFRQHLPSVDARHVANWVLHARDHAGQPFVVVDKVQSRVYVFDGAGVLHGVAPALVGLALGDDTAPGIGAKALSAIRPEERTTPAGRFPALLARGSDGREILWVDYDSGVALHAVSAGIPRERRLQRMASLVMAEHRITYGCINVPAAFFAEVVAPLFRAGAGMVYVLPETRSAQQTFGSYEPVFALEPVRVIEPVLVIEPAR